MDNLDSLPTHFNEICRVLKTNFKLKLYEKECQTLLLSIKKNGMGASLALIASGSVWATNGNSPSPHADMIQSIMQQKTIKGTVVDETGEPIIGANVVEKGTTNGVTQTLMASSH